MHPNHTRAALQSAAPLLPAPGSASAAIAGLAAFVLSASVHAQSGDAPTRRSPLDAQAEVPAVNYRSPFAGYRTGADQKPRSWRELNDTVERVGGWRAYLKEAQQPEAQPAPAAPAMRGETAPKRQPESAPKAQPAPPASGGHKH